MSNTSKEIPLNYVIIANPECDVEVLHEVKNRYDFLNFQIRHLTLDDLYTFLHASDVLLINRESS